MSKEDYNKIVNDVEKIASALPEDLKTQLGETLSSIRYNAQGLSDDVGTLLKETMSRKEKIRELENNVTILSQEKDKLSNSDQVAELNAKIEELTGFKNQVFSEKRNGYLKRIESIKDSPNFDKVKDFITLPVEKDGKLSLEGIEDDKVIKSLSELEKFEKLGIFSTQKALTPKTNPKVIDYANFDPVKLLKEDPAAYDAWRKQQGFK